jgi:hypothetical protein
MCWKEMRMLVCDGKEQVAGVGDRRISSQREIRSCWKASGGSDEKEHQYVGASRLRLWIPVYSYSVRIRTKRYKNDMKAYQN